MKIHKLGHVVLHVRNRERAEQFYNGVLGLPIAARYEPVPATFFSLGTDHHVLAVIAVGDNAPSAPDNAPGLRHVAFKIGDSQAELVEAQRTLEAAGCEVAYALDHGITLSMYVKDPDGNTVELYVDVSDAWKQDPSQITLTPKPLRALTGG